MSTPHTKHKKMHPEHRRSRFKPRPVCDLEARGCFKHRTCALGQIRRCTGTMFEACLKPENMTGTSFELILLPGRLNGWLAAWRVGWLASWLPAAPAQNAKLASKHVPAVFLSNGGPSKHAPVHPGKSRDAQARRLKHAICLEAQRARCLKPPHRC